jgi:hypothetical protein
MRPEDGIESRFAAQDRLMHAIGLSPSNVMEVERNAVAEIEDAKWAE